MTDNIIKFPFERTAKFRAEQEKTNIEQLFFTDTTITDANIVGCFYSPDTNFTNDLTLDEMFASIEAVMENKEDVTTEFPYPDPDVTIDSVTAKIAELSELAKSLPDKDLAMVEFEISHLLYFLGHKFDD